MDFTGIMIPIVPFSSKYFKATGHTMIKSKIGNSLIVEKDSYNKLIENKDIDNNGKRSESVIYNKNEIATNEERNDSAEIRIANMSKLKPNVGVTIKLKNELIQGPNFEIDPMQIILKKHKATTSLSFDIDLNKSDFQGTHNYITGEKMNRTDNINRDLLLNSAGKNTPTNQGFIGTIPIGFFSRMRYSNRLPNINKHKATVTIQKSLLKRSIDEIESSQNYANNSKPLQHLPSLNNKKTSASLTRRHKMPPPPIGKTLGHGIFGK